MGEQQGFEGSSRKTTESPSPAARPRSAKHPAVLRRAIPLTRGGAQRAGRGLSAQRRGAGHTGVPSPAEHTVRLRPTYRDAGTPVVGPSLRLLAASGWLSLRGSLPIRLLASCAQSTILDPMPAHPTRIASLHGDGRQWPQTHEGGPSSTPTCPGAVVWVQMQTQKGSGCWDNAEHPPTPSRPAVQASLNCRRWCWPAGPNLTLVIAPFCAWRPAEALRPWAAGFRIILLCPLNKHKASTLKSHSPKGTACP